MKVVKMLYLIGLGVCGDITEKGKEAIKKADEVWIDAYTTSYDEEVVNEIIGKIKKMGKKVVIAKREMLESNEVFDNAKNKNLAICCFGDPLFATTHISLLVEAKKRNIKYVVIPNAGIINAVFMLGLSPYRFGETVTIGKWQEDYKPYLWIGKIERNLRSSLHTICLIDPLISEGSELLYIINKAIEKYKEEKKKKTLKVEKIEKVFLIKNAFCKNEEIDYLPLNEIDKKNVKNATIVFPSMTRLEESFVSILFGK